MKRRAAVLHYQTMANDAQCRRNAWLLVLALVAVTAAVLLVATAYLLRGLL